MGKSSRKNKEKKKDFQKVKLKIGKKKPMPDNFTKTAFKSQSILLKEQFRETDSSTPRTQKKQTIQDLLCTINHYNAKVRVSALVSLKELLLANRQLIQDNLAALVQNIAHTFTDKEKDVRQAGHAVVQQMAASVKSELMVPFFAVVCAHLCCAMTHLQEDIQLDALKVLDLLLARYPLLVITRSRELLTNFVHQISQQGGHHDGAEMQLNTSPGNKFSGQKWRIQVLLRLKGFLSAIIDSKLKSASGDRLERGEEEKRKVVISTDEVYVGIYRDGFTSDDVFTLRSFTHQGEGDSQDFTSNIKEVVEFARKVIPLILQCWMEARPNLHGNHTGGASLTMNSVQTLHGVLSVLRLLWKWLDLLCQEQQQRETLTDMRQSFEKKLLKAVFTDFPYSLLEGGTDVKRQTKQKMVTARATLQQANILVCEVVSYLINPDQRQGWTGKLIRYVRDVLDGDAQLSTEHAQMLLDVVVRLMNNLTNEDSKSTLLEALIHFYQNSHILSQSKRLSMTCIGDLAVLSYKPSCSLTRTPLTDQFIRNIPMLLIELKSKNVDTSHHALHILLRSAAMAHPSAGSCIQDHFVRLLDPKNLLIQEYPENLQRQLVELLHWTKEVHLASFKVLCAAFLSDKVPASVVSYAIQILTCKLLSNDELPFDVTDFVSFLVTISLGYQMEELLRLQQEALEGIRQPPSQSSHFMLKMEPLGTLSKHKRICQVMCQSLRSVSEDTTWKVFQQVTAKLMKGINVVPFSSAYGLIHVTYENSIPSYMRDDFVGQFTQLMASVLCRTVRDYGDDFPEDGWEETLWQAVVRVLAKSPNLLKDTFNQLKMGVENYEDKEQLRLTAFVVIRLLQTEGLKQALIDSVSSLAEFMVAIQRATEDFDETRWLAELKYESDLFLGSMQKR